MNHPCWEIMAGMLLREEEARFRVVETYEEQCNELILPKWIEDAWPDLEDPATRGCFRFLINRLYNGRFYTKQTPRGWAGVVTGVGAMSHEADSEIEAMLKVWESAVADQELIPRMEAAFVAIFGFAPSFKEEATVYDCVEDESKTWEITRIKGLHYASLTNGDYTTKKCAPDLSQLVVAFTGRLEALETFKEECQARKVPHLSVFNV